MEFVARLICLVHALVTHVLHEIQLMRLPIR
jgi:hypothetical protein